jgi:hypothetical protein
MRSGRYSCALSAGLLGCLATQAQAGGPYAVDDAAIGEPGECQVESWLSAAGNGDRVAVVQPACVVRLGLPVELTATYQPVRIGGVGVDLLGGQIKFIFLRFGDLVIAVSVGTLVDIDDGESLTLVNLPMTIKLNDDLRLNVNAGWLRASATDSSHLFTGFAVEWDFHSSWTVIAEVFGQTGPEEQPRMQAGLRYAAGKAVDLDIVYGHNLTGEQASWATAGVNVRF